MSRSTMSLRLDDELRERLVAAAAAEGTSVTSIVERFIREGLAVAEHPGVVFKPGPSSRRAALAGGPDVWEIASALRHTSGTEAERVTALAEEFGLGERQIVIALNCIAAHREEIAAQVAGQRPCAGGGRAHGCRARSSAGVKFVVDAMLPPAVAERLNVAGHIAFTPSQLGAHSLPDDVIVEIATSERAVVVTENATDFAHVTTCPVLFVR